MVDEEREIGALWAKEGSKGTYYTGTVNGHRVVMFKQKDTSNGKPSFKILKEKEREI